MIVAVVVLERERDTRSAGSDWRDFSRYFLSDGETEEKINALSSYGVFEEERCASTKNSHQESYILTVNQMVI